MLILAIDTALDACAALVLDTDTGKVVAQESQAMKRGHAEALMPLVARVMKQSGVAFQALDRIAATTGPGRAPGPGTSFYVDLDSKALHQAAADLKAGAHGDALAMAKMGSYPVAQWFNGTATPQETTAAMAKLL